MSVRLGFADRARYAAVLRSIAKSVEDLSLPGHQHYAHMGVTCSYQPPSAPDRTAQYAAPETKRPPMDMTALARCSARPDNNHSLTRIPCYLDPARDYLDVERSSNPAMVGVRVIHGKSNGLVYVPRASLLAALEATA